MRRKRGGWGRPWCSVFCPVTSRGAPREPWERWAASRPLLWFHALMLFALSGANCFSAAQNTRPVLFIMMILSYNSVPGAQQWRSGRLPLTVWYFSPPLCFPPFSQSLHCYFDLMLSPLLFPRLSPPFHASLPNLSSISLSLSLCPLLLLSNFLARLSFPFIISLLFLPSSLLFLSSPLCFPLIYLP